MESFSDHIPSSSCPAMFSDLSVPDQQGEQFLQDFSFIVMSSLLSGPCCLASLTALNHINRLRERHVHSTKVVHSCCGHVECFMARMRTGKSFMIES